VGGHHRLIDCDAGVVTSRDINAPTEGIACECTHNYPDPARELLSFARDRKFATILADPPWRPINRTGETVPEYRRLSFVE
jgi:hypothetical protein